LVPIFPVIRPCARHAQSVISLAAFPFGLKSNRHALDQALYQQIGPGAGAGFYPYDQARIGDNLALVGCAGIAI
jgi:hypothetical protein